MCVGTPGWRRSAEREIELKSAETVGCDQASNDDAVNALLDGRFSDLLVSLKRLSQSNENSHAFEPFMAS
jgi:hypothetical protein